MASGANSLSGGVIVATGIDRLSGGVRVDKGLTVCQVETW